MAIIRSTRRRALADGSDEWSILVDDGSEPHEYDAGAPPRRLAIVSEELPGGFIILREGRVTSASESGEFLTTRHNEIIMTFDDAQWVLECLPAAIEAAVRRRASADMDADEPEAGSRP